MADNTPYWTTEVQYFFNETDKNAMFAVSTKNTGSFTHGPLDLGKYEDVKIYAQKISDAVKGDFMPAGQSPKWQQDRKDRFTTWIKADCPFAPSAT
jgi:hypothetical protein